jgi:hypothetical protein
MSFNLNNLDEENYDSEDNEKEEKKEIEDNLISAKSKKYKLQEKKKEEKKIVESTPLNISDKKKDDLFDDEINTINDENYPHNYQNYQNYQQQNGYSTFSNPQNNFTFPQDPNFIYPSNINYNLIKQLSSFLSTFTNQNLTSNQEYVNSNLNPTYSKPNLTPNTPSPLVNSNSKPNLTSSLPFNSNFDFETKKNQNKNINEMYNIYRTTKNIPFIEQSSDNFKNKFKNKIKNENKKLKKLKMEHNENKIEKKENFIYNNEKLKFDDSLKRILLFNVDENLKTVYCSMLIKILLAS